MGYSIEKMISEEEVNNRIRELGEQITRDYAGRSVRLVCILRGAVFFMCELAKRIELPVSFDFMSVSSYGSKTTSSGIVRIIKDLDTSIQGMNILLVEDIIDTGKTIKEVVKTLMHKGANSVKIVALLNKPEGRVVDVNADYIGFEIENEFVVGYGLDFNQRYRCLPYVGVLKEECYQN